MRLRVHAGARHGGLVAALALVLAASAAGAYSLTDVSLTRSDGGAVLDLTTSGTVRYQVFQLESPHRIVLDLMDADSAAEPVVSGEDPSGWFGPIRGDVNTDDPNARIVRYEIETQGPCTYGVTAEENHIRLCLEKAETAAATETAATTETAGPTETAQVVETKTPAVPAVPVVPAIPAVPAVPAVPAAPADLAPSLGAADPGAKLPALTLGGPEEEPPKPDLGPPMNLDVQSADVRTVLRAIAEFGKVNIVPDHDVSGPVTVKLSQVPWRRALDIVCESAELAALDREGVIRVATRKALMDEDLDRESTARKREELLPLETAILPVRYANADELTKSVSFILTKRGSIQSDLRTNSILVTDIGERVDQLRKMVADLDTETQQVEIVAKLVDVDVTAATQIGIVWNLANLHNSAQGISGSISHDSHISTPSTEFKFGMVRSWANIDATLQGLETTNKAKIISNPSITTVNNRQARILVGKEIPLIVLDKSGNPITDLKKVGITLEVTPYINSDNKVTMDLHPEVSDLSSQATVQGGVVFTTTEADTRVMVADGETAVIGGLISNSDTRFEQGVPFLKDVPIVGNLFKSSDARKDQRELMIFVTPKIVRSSASNQK